MSTVKQTLNVFANLQAETPQTERHYIIPLNRIGLVIYGHTSFVYLETGSILAVDCDYEAHGGSIGDANYNVGKYIRAHDNDTAIRRYASMSLES